MRGHWSDVNGQFPAKSFHNLCRGGEKVMKNSSVTPLSIVFFFLPLLAINWMSVIVLWA